jgi:TolB protein
MALRLRITFLVFITTVIAVTANAQQKIAFERDNQIWVANLDGSTAYKIAEGNLPDISPDGTRVAFNTNEPSEKLPIRHIAIADLKTGQVSVLKDVPSDNSFGPVWSPDGKWLLFSIYADDDWHLGLIRRDGYGFRFVKKAEKKDHSYYAPAWYPDGKSFLCHDLDEIYQFDLDGNTIKKWKIHDIVTKADMNSNSRIAVSPDGRWLVMDVDMDEDQDRENWDGPPPAVWFFDLTGTRGVRLTPKDFFAWDPTWINSEEVLFLSQAENEEEPSLYRCSIKQREIQRVLKDAATPSASQ